MNRSVESHIRSEQIFGSSKRIQFIGLSKSLTRPHKDQMSIESLLTFTHPRQSHTASDNDITIDSLLTCDIKEPPKKRQKRNKMLCYYSAVAQKSYGSEKRFLCPPPLIQVQHSQSHLQISTSVLCENQNIEQDIVLDENGHGSVRYLFVTASKAKHFKLQLNLLDQTSLKASFCTQPISIVSKPSKKTRNYSTSISPHSIVSLYNRINSQTVRTKYMTTGNENKLSAKSTWSPFEILTDKNNKLAFGSEIILRERQSGICSPPLILCKVDRGQFVPSVSPVSQMQKIALRQPDSDLYLSVIDEGPLVFSSPDKMNALIWTIVGVHVLEQEFDDDV